MSYFIANFAKEAKQQPEKKPNELKRWGKALAIGGLAGGIIGAPSAVNNVKKLKKPGVKKLRRDLENAFASRGVSRKQVVDMLSTKEKKNLFRQGYREGNLKQVSSQIDQSITGGVVGAAGLYGSYRGAKTIKNRIDKRREENK